MGVNYETKEDKLAVISRIESKEYRAGKAEVKTAAIFLLCDHDEGLVSRVQSHWESLRFCILWLEQRLLIRVCHIWMSTLVSALSKTV